LFVTYECTTLDDSMNKISNKWIAEAKYPI